jgi:cellulose synthase operon protein C
MDKSPDRFRLVAGTLARQGRFEEAIRLCEAAAAKDSSPLPLLSAAYVMLEGEPSAKDYERADAFLGRTAEQYSNLPEMLNALAALRIRQSRLDEAAVLLRRVIDLQPRDAVAMNNLATILVENPSQLSEAKTLVEQAIALKGPQAGLLDLKGMILLAEDKPREAIPLFEEACAAPQADPRFYFHWAVACQRVGNIGKAHEVFERAREKNFERQILTPGDKKLLSALEQQLASKKPGNIE